MADKLKDLDLSSEEVERFAKAFKDAKFREMFAQYAEEISDPENRKRYEEEICQMENERGVDTKFIHPHPGHVLLTSVNGVQKCYLNICSNDLIPKPGSKPAVDGEGRAGLQWSLPHSLTPGREDLGKDGSKHVIYDVVFHPDTLHISSKNDAFKSMVDSTALEAIANKFGVRLDTNNVKTLLLKYKGVPNPAVLRKPLSEASPKLDHREDPLCFPYPYKVPTGAENENNKQAVSCENKSSKKDEQTTVPHYTVRHRSYVDLQDYRDCRESAPSPVPKELVITVDLPLLNSASGVNLNMSGKNLSLESENPVYKLNVILPYSVEDNQGKAIFNKSKRQLVITVPVIQQKHLKNHFQEEKEEILNNSESAHNKKEHKEDSASEKETNISGENQLELSTFKCNGEGKTPEKSDLCLNAKSLPAAKCTQDFRKDDFKEVHERVIKDISTPFCPSFTCSQNESSLTLTVHVRDVDETSLKSEFGTNQYQIHFYIRHTRILHVLLVQFLPKDKINVNQISVNLSENNVVIGLTKSPESFGLWKNLFFGASEHSLQERRFVTEDNVNEFLACNISESPTSLYIQDPPPVINVIEMTEFKTHIQIDKPKHCTAIEQCQELSKSERITSMNFNNTVLEGTDEVHTTPCSENSDVKDNISDKFNITVDSPDEHQVIVDYPDEQQVTKDSHNKQQDLNHFKISYKVDCDDKIKISKNCKRQDSELDEDDTPDHSEDLQKIESQMSGQNLVLKEISSKDGSVQVITNHTTQCAFKFQNTLLYEMD
ncbi:hypothetical protein GDO86_016013 [Hymenochirus boettgeri]|uniref:Protein kintoun n=1 Tax=Hymenochirus boettgeri TaxID=247094 RepID=A0A8T2JVA1_9PIPI|nr:hypothetical protein GDO86_016013 [Hymenochirus boettgeri]